MIADFILFLGAKLLILGLFAYIAFMLFFVYMCILDIKSVICRYIVLGISIIPALCLIILLGNVINESGIWRIFTNSFSEYQTTPSRPTKILVETYTERFKLNGWRPPKHFYVDIENTKTHIEYNDLYVSKHCNTQGLKLGDEYNIRVNSYYMSNDETKKIKYEFVDLSSVFCN